MNSIASSLLTSPQQLYKIKSTNHSTHTFSSELVLTTESLWDRLA